MEMELLTIQQVATCTGLSVHTLRYYERVGLLEAVGRAPNGHRRYATVDLAWIAFLNRLRATGMPIRQMQQFARLRRQGDATVCERRVLLEQHQQAVQVRLRDLLGNLDAIAAKIKHYTELETTYATDR